MTRSRTPRAKPRPIAGSPQRKGRYPRPPAPTKPAPSGPLAHAALVPTEAPKPPPRASKRPPAEPQPEPAQQEGATLPTVERCSPTVVKCVDGLRGVVSRWECSATRLGALASFTRLSGAAVTAHPRTVERHREAVETWLRSAATAARKD